jgi:hypothetical protein
MKQALEALDDAAELLSAEDYSTAFQEEAITALRQAIEQAEKQEPVAFLRKGWAKWEPLYSAPVHASDISQERVDETPPCKTHPDAPHGFDRNASHSADRYVCECEGWEPPKEWVGLTVDEIDKFMPYCNSDQDLSDFRTFAFEIEAKLKEKNSA